MNYKIIVTLGEDELLDYKNPAIKEADILEIRLDLLEISFINEKLSLILKELAKPVLLTYRNPKDSSEASNTSLTYGDISDFLLEFNSENNYLDIELDQEKSIFDSIPNSKYTVIYSYHNFSSSITKEEMLNWISKKQKKNCVYKFAVSPKSISDLDKFLEDLNLISKIYKVIGIAMGEIGVYSRLFGDRFGSLATYCCIGKPRAPGQVNVTTLRKIRADYSNKPLPKIETKIAI
ncbi:MAG: type I 3-dehydroquinate dehydratase [Leptospiraceae bacterium]|nr:type I 3-dehydroquinate dehydratase [Leptospiraceae bacterium]